MPEERKPKIDLKARLGRAGGVPAPGVPTPAPAGVPMPGVRRASAPPPAAGFGSGTPPPPMAGPGIPLAGPGGVPAPPFAQPARRATVDTSDPFASVAASAAPRVHAPAMIKVEIGEEVVALQQKNSRRTMVVSILMCMLGGGLGYAFGGRAADGKGAERAVEGAQEIAGDIEKAQAKIKELNDKIGGAIKDLKDKKFPEQFANDLGGLSIPFGADKLTGRNIGRFDPKVLNSLFKYTGDVTSLNDRKDALRNLFSGQKPAIIDALASAGNPKVSWSVFVQKSPAHGPIAILAAVNAKDAFAYKDKWPDKYNISTGRELVEVDRYNSGDVFSAEKKVLAIPLDPDSVATSFPTDILVKITSELAKTGSVLAGRTGSTPDDEDPGVIANGDQLVIQLRKIGKN